MAIADNLSAYWKLEEASGNATDEISSIVLTDTNTVTSATGKVGSTARQFTAANSEYLIVADTAALRLSDAEYTWGVWCYANSLGDFNRRIFCKINNPLTLLEYQLFFKRTGDVGFNPNRFTFEVFGASNAVVGTVVADALGAPSTATWYLILVSHSAVSNQVRIKVNNGTANTASTTGAPTTKAAPFCIGSLSNVASTFWDGRIGPIMMWDRLLTTQEETDLWNSGNGLQYPLVPAGSATAFTLSGPSAGPAGAASADFTVEPDGTTSDTFTPDAIGGVTYSPSTLTWTGDDVAKTFTVNKATPGNINVNGALGALTPPSDVAYEAKATVTRTLTVDGSVAGHDVEYAIKNNDATFFSEFTASGVTDQGGGVFSVSAEIPEDRAGIVQWFDVDDEIYTSEDLPEEPTSGGGGGSGGVFQTGVFAS
jgi:hypothetical protein